MQISHLRILIINNINPFQAEDSISTLTKPTQAKQRCKSLQLILIDLFGICLSQKTLSTYIYMPILHLCLYCMLANVHVFAYLCECVRETERVVCWSLALCLSVCSDQSCLAVICPLPAVKGLALGMPTYERLQPCSRIHPAL